MVWHAFDNDLIVNEPQAVIDYGLSFPPGEFATAEQRIAFEAAIRSSLCRRPASHPNPDRCVRVQASPPLRVKPSGIDDQPCSTHDRGSELT